MTAPAPLARAVTDGNGEAVFAALNVGSFAFSASKPGFARRGETDVLLAGGDGERRIGLALERGHRMAGRVLEQDGRAVPGALVVAVRRTTPADAQNAPLTLRARSDDEGRYALDSLPAADICIWVARPGGRLALVAAVRPPGVPDLDLVLPRAVLLVGTVTDGATGAAVGEAEVVGGFSILGGIDLRLEGGGRRRTGPSESRSRCPASSSV